MFNVTYEIVSQKSSENGDFAESGYIAKNVSLREAVEYLFQSRTSHNSGVFCVEPSDSNIKNARWVTVQYGMEYLTGDCENRSIHFPETITPSSRARIFKLLNT